MSVMCRMCVTQEDIHRHVVVVYLLVDRFIHRQTYQDGSASRSNDEANTEDQPIDDTTVLSRTRTHALDKLIACFAFLSACSASFQEASNVLKAAIKPV